MRRICCAAVMFLLFGAALSLGAQQEESAQGVELGAVLDGQDLPFGFEGGLDLKLGEGGAVVAIERRSVSLDGLAFDELAPR
ncbi:MAG: hypothetical protein HY716_04565 [Planctomycetes bacterium]|nr:hypothetical protein [Planctomycetota bacterium]